MQGEEGRCEDVSYMMLRTSQAHGFLFPPPPLPPAYILQVCNSRLAASGHSAPCLSVPSFCSPLAHLSYPCSPPTQMICNSPQLQVILLIDMAALLMYNLTGMMVTGHMGAVFR